MDPKFPNLVQSLLEEAVDLTKVSRNPEARENPPKSLPKHEVEALLTEFHKPTAGFAYFETPDDDMSEIERILSLEQYSLGTFYVKTDESHRFCGHCGRQNNFLDVVKTAIEGDTHSAEFLRKVLSGHYGHVVNSNRAQRCDCAGCGKQLAATKFVGAGPTTRAQGPLTFTGGDYIHPVYSHPV